MKYNLLVIGGHNDTIPIGVHQFGDGLMKTVLSTQSIDTLWHRFKATTPKGDSAITLDGLAKVVGELGHSASSEELQNLMDDANPDEGIGYQGFMALMASLQGDSEARIKVAFDLLDENGDGRISPDELHNILGPFNLTDDELHLIFSEADRNGDGLIDFDEFHRLMPQDHRPTDRCYCDTVTPFASTLRSGSVPTVEALKAPPPPTQPSMTIPTPGVGSIHHRNQYGHGTSTLQLQIGLFRLLQGAAYRCFRESYSAHAMTHLRASDLPYTIPDFVAFVERTIALYKALGVVDPACFPVLDAVTASVNAEYVRLQDRIANWPAVEKTEAMQAAANAMNHQWTRSASIRDKLAAGVELALTLRRKNLTLSDVDTDSLARHELCRMRHVELNEEMASPPAGDGADPKAYLATWNRVLIASGEEVIEGAMMPAAYWYEDFMPKLLAACSVSTAGDIAKNTVPDKSVLDEWFSSARDAGEFARYGADVLAQFADCSDATKLSIHQAWWLTRHYLNGVQKRREREEFGRESGFLSQYVAFLDVYLGRSDVRQAQMRVSFPYYIGRPTWRFLHTVAELVNTREPDEQLPLVDLFKEFFRKFAMVYPCPYCRHHLNAYVVRNAEIKMYPIEYLVLGPHLGNSGHSDDLQVSIEDKLAAITDGPSLRLFLWKLHNSVSASIERTEPWYRRDDSAIYTTRHWPSLDAELARSRAFGHDHISVDRLKRIHCLLKPVWTLATLRHELHRFLTQRDGPSLPTIVDEARAAVADLERALSTSEILEQTYTYDPTLEDDPPHLSPEEEAYGRSGQFVEA